MGSDFHLMKKQISFIFRIKERTSLVFSILNMREEWAKSKRGNCIICTTQVQGKLRTESSQLDFLSGANMKRLHVSYVFLEWIVESWNHIQLWLLNGRTLGLIVGWVGGWGWGLGDLEGFSRAGRGCCPTPPPLHDHPDLLHGLRPQSSDHSSQLKV